MTKKRFYFFLSISIGTCFVVAAAMRLVPGTTTTTTSSAGRPAATTAVWATPITSMLTVLSPTVEQPTSPEPAPWTIEQLTWQILDHGRTAYFLHHPEVVAVEVAQTIMALADHPVRMASVTRSLRWHKEWVKNKSCFLPPPKSRKSLSSSSHNSIHIITTIISDVTAAAVMKVEEVHQDQRSSEMLTSRKGPCWSKLPAMAYITAADRKIIMRELPQAACKQKDDKHMRDLEKKRWKKIQST